TVADYLASGVDYRPPVQPMETLEELARVVGMTPEIIAAIHPHLSLYGPQTPDSTAADPVVAAALGVVREPPRASRARRGRRGGDMTARITGTAYGPENAEITRIAVVRLNPAIPGRGVKLAWEHR